LVRSPGKSPTEHFWLKRTSPQLVSLQLRCCPSPSVQNTRTRNFWFARGACFLCLVLL
jgi:hypothetical protein